MKKLFSIGVILLVLLLNVSCEKEQVTDIVKIENELAAFVSENNVSKCTIELMFANQVNTIYTNESFTISNGFLRIVKVNGNYKTEDRFNLLYLSRYSLASDKVIVLTFAQ